MNTLAPGKFEVKIGDTEREVNVPFGLKTEIYRFLAKKHLERIRLRSATGVSDATSNKVRDFAQDLEKAKALEPPNEELVRTLNTQLERAQNDAYNEFTQNRARIVEESLLKSIDLEDDAAMELLSMILSERDDRGKIITKLDTEELKWSKVYTDSMPELIDLLQAVIDYITETVKKISGISQVMEEKKVQ